MNGELHSCPHLPVPMPDPPAWFPLSREACERAWEISQNAPYFTAAQIAELRPVLEPFYAEVLKRARERRLRERPPAEG